MEYVKRGFIYGPAGESEWAQHTALTPTPILLNDDVIRVYAGFRSNTGVSRIGYVDVEAKNPLKVVTVSREPALDVGKPGCFDDNGVILGDVIRHGDKLSMYYVGFQLVSQVKFLAFTGLAISSDGGHSFVRQSNTPILDRTDEGLYIRALHTVIHKDGRWAAWYATGSEWTMIEGKPFPNYHIRMVESADGINFKKSGSVCLLPEKSEYRIGRPRVYPTSSGYEMFFTFGTVEGDYLPGYATSLDGVSWQRKDDKVGIRLSADGWDSKTLCYPSLLNWRDRTYMFYNGNDMGRSGFGYAELKKS
jgi:hypothetical protein